MKNPKTTEERSKIMGSIKAVSKLENMVTEELWSRGYRIRRNVRSLKGTPDIAIKKYKLVIFIDSCFWHLCPVHGKIPKSNVEFWTEKLRRNQQRDKDGTYYDFGSTKYAGNLKPQFIKFVCLSIQQNLHQNEGLSKFGEPSVLFNYFTSISLSPKSSSS